MATTTPLLLVWRRQWLWKRGFGFPPEVAQRRRQGPPEPVQPVLPPTHPPPLPGPEAKLWFRAVAGPEGGEGPGEEKR